MPTVITRLPGRRKPLLPDWQLPLPPDDDGGGDGSQTLRDILSRIVRHEVAAFQKRQQSQRLITVLSEDEIRDAVKKGRVLSGGRTEIEPQEVDPEQAVGAALLAFEDGIFLVFIDEVEQTDLDRQVFLTDESTITLIRLTLLSGA